MNYRRFLLLFGLSLAVMPALILILVSAGYPARVYADPAVVTAAKMDKAAASRNRLDGPPADRIPQNRRQGTAGSAVIANGDFENGRDGSWQEYSGHGWHIIMDSSSLAAPPHGGNWAAWLGGEDDDVSSIEQDVIIPGGASTLSYWNWIASADVCGYDAGRVLIDGAPIQGFWLCDETNTNGWVKRSVDLSAFAGQTVAVQFRVETDAELNSNFFVDDVTLDTTPPGTAEPTAGPTAEPTAKPTTKPPTKPVPGAFLPVILKEYRVESECRYDPGIPEDYYPVESPYISHVVKIDGKISSSTEWSQAFCVDLLMREELDSGTYSYRVRWWVQNDGQYVYYLARVGELPPPGGVAVDYFWPTYNGSWPHSDGLFVNSGGHYIDMANWDEEQWYEDIDLSPPGTVDLKADASLDKGYYWFEIKRDLNSGDQWDWAVEPGQTIGHNPEDSFLFALIFEDSYAVRNVQLHLGEP